MGYEGKEKWSLFSPLLGVYSTRETGLIYPLNINKQSNHPKITLVSVGGLIAGLKLSAGYTIHSQDQNEVFSGVTIYTLCECLSVSLQSSR